MTNAFHAFEQAGWNRAAQPYADAFATLTPQTAGPLLEAAGVVAGTRLLDVASGPGFIAAAALARGAAATALDFSPAMIAEAARRHPGLVVQEGDASALPFPDASFDAVVMNFGMLHLARQTPRIYSMQPDSTGAVLRDGKDAGSLFGRRCIHSHAARRVRKRWTKGAYSGCASSRITRGRLRLNQCQMNR